jgi:two-component system, NarL family, sensor histidine kinase DegS
VKTDLINDKIADISQKITNSLEYGRQVCLEIFEDTTSEINYFHDELEKLKCKIIELQDEEEVLLGKIKEEKKSGLVSYEDREMLITKNKDLKTNANKEKLNLEDSISFMNDTIRIIMSITDRIDLASACMKGDPGDEGMKFQDTHQKQLLGLKIIKAKEEERQRLARDMHDGPAQSMSNVVMKAELCEKLIGVDKERASAEIKKLKGNVKDCLNDVRKIIFNLRPVLLEQQGLIEAVKRHIDSFCIETGIQLSFRSSGVYNDIDHLISLAIFRIIQEAVSNIAKHSGAQTAAVSLDFTDSTLALHIYDNGVGFEPGDHKGTKDPLTGGFGLMSMKERVELLNGTFNLSSKKGKGTIIDIKVPILVKNNNT